MADDFACLISLYPLCPLVPVHYVAGSADHENGIILDATDECAITIFALVQLSLCPISTGYVVDHHQFSFPPMKRQRVGGDLHIGHGAILKSVPAQYEVLQSRPGVGYIFQQHWNIFRRANIGNPHGQEFVARISEALSRSIVDFEKLQGFQVVDPHRLRMVYKQNSKAGVVLAQPDLRDRRAGINGAIPPLSDEMIGSHGDVSQRSDSLALLHTQPGSRSFRRSPDSRADIRRNYHFSVPITS
jgi:hypothetical protein